MKKIFIYAGLLASILAAGCNKMLEEKPKSVLTPDYLQSVDGIRRAMDAAYAGGRYFWGGQDLFVMTTGGTDEFKKGVDGNTDLNAYSSNFNNTNSNLRDLWKFAYQWINACNGILEYAPVVNQKDPDAFPVEEMNKIIGEAKFMRAQYYSVLVQFWRDVTISTKFQQEALTTAKRDPLADVYELIISDLTDAVAKLPPSPKSDNVAPGKASAAAARHLLGRMYLSRGGSPAAKASDNEDAYRVLSSLINDLPSLGLRLLPDFADIFREGNESNEEVLFTVQHTNNYPFNGPNNSTQGDNVMNHMFVGQYDVAPGMVRSMEYGRPYIREVPTRWLLQTAFAERVNDTRYNKTFQTVWFANSPFQADYEELLWPNPLPAGAPADAVAGKPRIKKRGDTSIYMPGRAVSSAEVARAPYRLIGEAPVGANPNSPANIYATSLGPTVKKYFDTKRQNFNDQSVRPCIVYRLGDTYLLAAEAAIKTSRTTEAVTFINEVRKRAAYPTGNPATIQIGPAEANIDWLLDERSRELCGEITRWWDLTRNNKLVSRVRLYNEEAKGNIQDKHALRAIPQTQLDATRGEPYKNNLYFPDWN